MGLAGHPDDGDVEHRQGEHARRDEVRLRLERVEQGRRVAHQVGPVAEHLLPEEREDRAPHRRPHDRPDAVRPGRHAHDSGRNADQVPHDRKESREEDAARLVTGEEALGLFELGGRNHEVLPVAHNERATERPRGDVHHHGPDEGSGRPGEHHPDEAHLALRGPVGSGRDHELARHGEDRRLHRHQEEDAEVVPVPHPAKPGRDQLVHHQAPLLREPALRVKPARALRQARSAAL